VLLAAALLTTLPVWLLLALAASPLVPGHLRVPRLVFLAIVYVVWDAAALVALAVLWVASGFGWKIRNPAFQRAHYVLTGRFLAVLFWLARWSLHLTVDVVGTDPDTAVPGRPEIVVSRHAGPGDSFILIHAARQLVRPRAADRAEGHPAVGPGGRRAAQPPAEQVHLTRPVRKLTI
jgi:1-acyl-sn-glycerol-3-phosphate acyltransferase